MLNGRYRLSTLSGDGTFGRARGQEKFLPPSFFLASTSWNLKHDHTIYKMIQNVYKMSTFFLHTVYIYSVYVVP